MTLSGFLHSHIVRCRRNPISCVTHYSGPGLSENDSAVTTDVCEDQNREVESVANRFWWQSETRYIRAVRGLHSANASFTVNG